MAELARILIYGDIHLNSKNYGAHVNYAKESLHYFKYITDKAEELKATHIIGLGDLTYGRFHSLEYRAEVEQLLERQFKLTNGNRYELKGNHDSATYGMTEYEYYVSKGLLKESTNLRYGNVNISMVDHNKHLDGTILPPGKDGDINVVLAHNFFKFKDTRIADYGKAVELDNFTDWFGVDYLICGHIHKYELFDGIVIKDAVSHPMVVNYVGCLCRPSYRAGHMDEVGHLVYLVINDDNTMRYDILDVPLWKMEESFNIDEKMIEQQKKEEKAKRVDISDIVQQLNSHERSVGNPEDIIEAMSGIDERYKKKAIELLKNGQA